MRCNKEKTNIPGGEKIELLERAGLFVLALGIVICIVSVASLYKGDIALGIVLLVITFVLFIISYYLQSKHCEYLDEYNDKQMVNENEKKYTHALGERVTKMNSNISKIMERLDKLERGELSDDELTHISDESFEDAVEMQSNASVERLIHPDEVEILEDLKEEDTAVERPERDKELVGI